ncbi:MAG: hypothetical protein NC132_01495 [Corallococcus sp.]|nr:hypothetical protein [Corallococcus sp.]MCM1359332.1 hypothetical protein [Corallococcus sp.]MCM1394775.1 hypothetical protein [Corallococcus sp.]
MANQLECIDCAYCKYLGNGQFKCRNSDEIIINNWQATEHYNGCRIVSEGKQSDVKLGLPCRKFGDVK